MVASEKVTDNARPLRADAQRNRDKLLAAATEAFAAEGEDVALETVAAIKSLSRFRCASARNGRAVTIT